MIAITDKLHVALQEVCGQLPTAQVEQLVAGLRAAIPIPESMAKTLRANPLTGEIEALERRLDELKEQAERHAATVVGIEGASGR